jgi:hypothetical protein
LNQHGFFPAVVARAERSRAAAKSSSPAAGWEGDFQTIKKRFSKDMTYAHFGNGKKQVHGVEPQSR